MKKQWIEYRRGWRVAMKQLNQWPVIGTMKNHKSPMARALYRSLIGAPDYGGVWFSSGWRIVTSCRNWSNAVLPLP